ncbi:SapC family protein [Aurantimonas sp. DM33-3]|uniref:SapC family protein n=1 Tax=Aurantimonas sp. DM33-3 TaxID=2766955 RepID=UPI001651F5E9|nr:SapC family protein [Aurantimonas sp. DM33-3]MBC6718646.1 SapC family protein [Aurantimonas sp. DM33-3]
MSSTESHPSDIRPLSWERHKGKRWQGFRDYNFARTAALVPIAGFELLEVTMSLPIAFLQKGDGWQCVAVMGLVPGQNLFVGPDGRWLGGYVPGSLRVYPFAIGRSAENDNQVFCIDESSELLGDEGGEPLFAEKGELSESAGKVWAFLQTVSKGETLLANAAALLAKSGVIEPWPITLQDGEAKRTVEGLHRVSEEKLNQLDDMAFLDLRRAGVLALAYGQLFSSVHLKKVGELASAHANHAAAKKEQEIKSQSRSNGIGVSDSLNIDWSKIGG